MNDAYKLQELATWLTDNLNEQQKVDFQSFIADLTQPQHNDDHEQFALLQLNP